MNLADPKYWAPFEFVKEPMIVLNNDFEIVWANIQGMKHLNLFRKPADGSLCELWTEKHPDCPVRNFFSKKLENVNGVLKSQPDFESIISPLQNDDDSSQFWLLSPKDVGRKKELESYVQTTYSRFKSLFEEFPAALIVFDKEMRVEYCNKHFYDFFGKNKSDVFGHKLKEISVISTISKLSETIEHLVDTDQRQNFFIEHEIKDKTYKLEINLFHINSFVPDSSEYCLSIADKTEYNELHRDATLLYHAVSASKQGLSILDDNFEIIFCNDAFVQLLPSDDIIGSKLINHFVDTTEANNFTESILKHLKKYGAFHSEVDWETDSTNGVFDFSVSSISLDEFNFSGFIVSLNDISTEKRYESWMEEARKMDSLYDLAFSFIHDFKNMLTSIQGSADMIRRKNPDTDEQKLTKYLNIIDRTTQTAAQMLENLVKVKVDGVKASDNLNICELVQKSHEIALSSFDKNIQIIVESDEAIVVQGNEADLIEVFMNLFINACEILPDNGEIRIKWKRQEFDKSMLWNFPEAMEGQYIKIVVSDNGPGISEKNKTRIFEPFFTTKSKRKVSGLGLSIVYNIVRYHEGFIEVESEPQKGTTFLIYFPIS